VGTLFVLLRQASDVEEVSIKLSFLEIYNEVVRDLLNPHNMKLRIRERPDDSIFVEGLVESFVTSEREIFSLIARGEANRSVGATDMNKSSSRSHSLLTLTIEQKGKDGSTRVGKLNFGGNTIIDMIISIQLFLHFVLVRYFDFHSFTILVQVGRSVLELIIVRPGWI
jgi:hypothetical protein